MRGALSETLWLHIMWLERSIKLQAVALSAAANTSYLYLAT